MWMAGIVFLASCEYNIIRGHENLVQHPSNNISICAFACITIVKVLRYNTVLNQDSNLSLVKTTRGCAT